jgi:hypothetical protein
MDELGLSGNTAVDWFNFCRELCQEYIVQKSKKQIGGEGKIVEIDESKFAKVKYGRGHPVKLVGFLEGLRGGGLKTYFWCPWRSTLQQP